MADATCRTQRLDGIIRGTNMVVTMSSGANADDIPGLVQSFQLQFQRRLSRVYDLTSPSFYYIEGPPEGTVSFSKVIGPKGFPKLGCDCTPRTIVLDASAALCYGADPETQNNARYVLKDAFPMGLSGQGTAENFIVFMGVSYMFGDMA